MLFFTTKEDSEYTNNQSVKMEYTFKQIPRQHQKKIVAAIVVNALIALGLLFLSLYLCELYSCSKTLSITFYSLSFVLPTIAVVYSFNQRLAVNKTITLKEDHLFVMERNASSPAVESSIDGENSNSYKVFPEMIKGYRYISGSDEANHFHVMTHEKTNELVVPEPWKRADEYRSFTKALELWLEQHQIKRH